jgi:enamine deaminase RidA (YjgF/YER057c/UK114 family)
MKKVIYFASIYLALFIAVPSIQSQAQEAQDYTFIRGPMGPQVCLGKYAPPTADAVSGVCAGQVFDLAQFNAVSTKLSADRLDQTVQVLQAIDDKLAANNDKVDRLIEVVVATQASSDKQTRELGETIEKRFDAVPAELLSNDLFKQELTKLKADILKEVEKRYQPRTAPAVK